ncbi:MAG TPA: hypothetical protein VK961_11490 [Chthoniobacter sp.]|nr:hypothetical protein [Chthoniobacter sp.]
MSTARKPISVLKVLVWASLPVALLVLLIVVAPFAWGWQQEQRWQAYRQGALMTRKVLELPPLPPAMDPAINFAGQTPFAAVPVDREEKPTQPPTLPADWVPKFLPVGLQSPEGIQLADFREPWHLEKVPDASLPAAILHVCDEQLAGKWQSVLDAEAKPQARFGVHSWPRPVSEKLPVADVKTASWVHTIRAIALVRAHRGHEALGELRGTARIATALQSESTIVARVLRAGVLWRHALVVKECLSAEAWSDAELAALDQELAPLHASTNYAETIDTERGGLNAIVECLVSQSASGRARQIREWYPEKDFGPAMLAFLCRWHGALRDNQLAINRYMDAVRQQIDEKGNWQPSDLPIDFDDMESGEEIRYALAGIVTPRYTRPAQHLLTAEACLRQARLAVALERFRREHAAFPDHLSQLAPQYLHSVPVDPMDGEEMRYAKDSANRFRLWSVGQDLEDDGGKVEIKKDSDDKEEKDEPDDIVWLGTVAGK